MHQARRVVLHGTSAAVQQPYNATRGRAKKNSNAITDVAATAAAAAAATCGLLQPRLAHIAAGAAKSMLRALMRGQLADGLCEAFSLLSGHLKTT